jgi:hypothetical protein
VEYVIASLRSFRISRATAKDRNVFYKRQDQAWDSEITVLGLHRHARSQPGRGKACKTLCLTPGLSRAEIGRWSLSRLGSNWRILETCIEQKNSHQLASRLSSPIVEPRSLPQSRIYVTYLFMIMRIYSLQKLFARRPSNTFIIR